MVLCVVDLEDFDGSLPREALQELLPSLAEDASISTAGYRLVIAANKADLFPSQATQSRLKVIHSFNPYQDTNRWHVRCLTA